MAHHLRTNKGGLGDLGGGNHFLDAIAPYSDGPIYFLIHTGSRNESGHVDALIGDASRSAIVLFLTMNEEGSCRFYHLKGASLNRLHSLRSPARCS